MLERTGHRRHGDHRRFSLSLSLDLLKNVSTNLLVEVWGKATSGKFKSFEFTLNMPEDSTQIHVLSCSFSDLPQAPKSAANAPVTNPSLPTLGQTLSLDMVQNAGHLSVGVESAGRERVKDLLTTGPWSSDFVGHATHLKFLLNPACGPREPTGPLLGNLPDFHVQTFSEWFHRPKFGGSCLPKCQEYLQSIQHALLL